MQTYLVKFPIVYNGFLYAPGRRIKLDETQAAPLLASGHIQAIAAVAGAEAGLDAEAALAERSLFLAGIAKATKAQIAEFAWTEYNLTLTGSKDEMIAAVLDAEARTAQ